MPTLCACRISSGKTKLSLTTESNSKSSLFHLSVSASPPFHCPVSLNTSLIQTASLVLQCH